MSKARINELNLDHGASHILYCMVLRVKKAFKERAPDVLQVTDFTRNPIVANHNYPKPYIGSDWRLQDDQVFSLDVFRFKFKDIEAQYFSRYNQRLGVMAFLDSDENLMMLADRLLVLKVEIDLKVYQGTLEARTRTIQLINPDEESGKAYTDDLFRNMVQHLPSSYLNQDSHLQKKVIPAKFLDKQRSNYLESSQEINSSISTTRSYSQPQNATQPAHSQLYGFATQPAQSLYSSPSQAAQSTPYNYPTQAAQSIVKNESDLDNSLVPDTEFSMDYVSSPVREEFEDARESTQDIYSIAQLHRTDKRIDNQIYRVKGYVVGCNPTDWSHICVKTYELNNLTKQYELSDPTLRPIELLISETKPGNDMLLTPQNLITAVLTEKGIQNLFENRSIEQIYTSSTKLNDVFYNSVSQKRILEFYKILIPISQTEKVQAWTLRNFTLS